MRVSKYLKNLTPYQPGKPIEELVREGGGRITNIAKLASNENPLGPSKKAMVAIEAALANLALYPDANQFTSRTKLAEYFGMGLKKENFIIGHGSNDIIEFMIRAYCSMGDNIVISECGFAIYNVVAEISGIECRKAKTRGGRIGEEFSKIKFDLEKMADLVDENTRIVFIDNPNNPTGSYVPINEVETFLKKVKKFSNCVVVLDNAYEEYVTEEDYPTTQLCRELSQEFPNLMVMRTLSKAYGLAGLRIGYAIGREELIFYLHQMKPPFNVSNLALVALEAAIEDEEHVRATTELNQKMLGIFNEKLDEMGLFYPRSQTNFVLVDVGEPGQKIYENLLKEGLITRPVGGYGFKQHLRINTGREEESLRVMEALKRVLGK